MSIDSTTGETIGTILLSVMVLLSMTAVVPFSVAANADDRVVFESFDIEFHAANPEAPDDVTVRWDLAEDADDVEEIRIAVVNASGSPINLYRPGDTDVPNPFTVSSADNGSESADIVVENLTTATLPLKIPVGHCSRVDEVQVFAYDGDGAELTTPDIQRDVNCSPRDATETFAVTIEEYDEEVTAGEYVNVTATVENVGDVEGSQDIRFLVDGNQINVLEDLTLADNRSEMISFAYEAVGSDVPEIEIAVVSDDDIANRTVSVTEPAPAFFEVTNVDTSTGVTAGETLDVAVRVENIGDRNGTQDVALTGFDGSTVDIHPDLELTSGESVDLTLSWATEETDVETGTVTVRSENDTDAVTVTIHRVTVESITATLDEPTLESGEQTFVIVEATFTDGSTRDVTEDATFVSLDTEVATVTADGTVLAENEGTVEIEATFEGETATDTLTVSSPDTDESETDGDESSEGDAGEDDASTPGEDDASTPGESGDSETDRNLSDADESGDSATDSSDETYEGEETHGGDAGEDDVSETDESDDDAEETETDDGGSYTDTSDESSADEGTGDGSAGDSGIDGSDETGVDGNDDVDGAGDTDSESGDEGTSSIVVSPVVGWLLLVPLLVALRNRSRSS